MFVMDVIENNPALESLYLVRNTIEHSRDVNRLTDLIGCHPSLKHVVIEECGSWTPSDFLYPVITSSDRLRSISLEGNNISSMGRIDIGSFLATNSCLETLNLKGNQLNDDDAILIARALERNNTLTWLDLEMNNITQVGKDALFRTIFNPASLNSVADSNHMCGFNLNINGVVELPCIINVKYGSPRLVREMHLLAPNTVKKIKLLALLCAPYEKAAKIRLLDGVPLKLMPEVLMFVQHYPDPAYDFPDGLNSQMHWGFMSALRPDAPQTKQESNEGEKSGDGDDGSDFQGLSGEGSRGNRIDSSSRDYNQNIYYDDDGNRIDSSSRDYNQNNYYDDDSDDDSFDPKPAQIKRLNLVYEITRGWRMETGEPMCIFAGGDTR